MVEIKQKRFLKEKQKFRYQIAITNISVRKDIKMPALR